MKKPIFSLAPIRISIAKEFTVRERGLILDSLTIWQKATYGLLSFHVCDFAAEKLLTHDDKDTCYTVNITKFPSDHKEIQKVDKETNKTTGGYFCRNHHYAMIAMVCDRIFTNNHFIRIMLHELGHAVGLEHSIKNTVMYPFVGYMTERVTDLDLSMLIYKWRPKRLSSNEEQA